MAEVRHLTKDQLRRLGDAIEPFLGTPLEEEGRWRKMSDDDLWITLVCQVAVIGGAAGGARISEDELARERLAWSSLVSLTDGAALRTIHSVLRWAGVRYVGADVAADRKSAGLVHNLCVLRRAGGPRKYFRAIARKANDHERERALRSDLEQIGNKSARDLLIGVGMARDFIAFDSRVQKVLKALGVETDRLSDASRYRDLEEMLLAAVPELGVSCLAHLDRVLFNNADTILSRLGSGARSDGTIAVTLNRTDRTELERLAAARGMPPSTLAHEILASALGSTRR